ncbi:hydroxyisourate hydrolase [Oceanomicrobium pacificus]|uniref:5-hydroxyisourate hydrolase n=1 Tax=Oceanomicrobium pacificus TaxID=2692916 RepID=A0A6B0TN49_9RHOB|nr:hydroxyisourate hydrolase [Oceanomicrobium pacificus]MXU65286.1 hydroxyisourate hydrolase [Oceanomicrobium pacificus]
MGSLTTHVLDTSSGRPAEGLKISLYQIDGERKLLSEHVTNADGRCDAPLLTAESWAPGRYELLFHAGAYLDSAAGNLPEPKFLDDIPLRFGMAEDSHYHVPLLISPFGYSTYRGS